MTLANLTIKKPLDEEGKEVDPLIDFTSGIIRFVLIAFNLLQR
jgi:hypothetical protein